MRYAWRNLTFDAPDARDESTLLLVDEADPPTFNLTIHIDDLPGGAEAVEKYVVAQKAAPGAVLDKKSDRWSTAAPR